MGTLIRCVRSELSLLAVVKGFSTISLNAYTRVGGGVGVEREVAFNMTLAGSLLYPLQIECLVFVWLRAYHYKFSPKHLSTSYGTFLT